MENEQCGPQGLLVFQYAAAILENKKTPRTRLQKGKVSKNTTSAVDLSKGIKA